MDTRLHSLQAVTSHNRKQPKQNVLNGTIELSNFPYNFDNFLTPNCHLHSRTLTDLDAVHHALRMQDEETTIWAIFVHSVTTVWYFIVFIVFYRKP